MSLFKKLTSWYKIRSIKKGVKQKVDQLNQLPTENVTRLEDQSYPTKEPLIGKNDNEVKAYIQQYQSCISGIGAGWQPYLYEMIDELIDNGLKMEDQIWAKEKYGSFRCGIKASQQNLQLVFDKIVANYTSKINTICQFCRNKGINQQFNNWEYNLCLHHYLTFKYNIPYNAEVDYYLEHSSSIDQEDPAEYRHLSGQPYHILEEQLLKQKAMVLCNLLQEKWPNEKNSVRTIMHRYFDETEGTVVEADGIYYRGNLQFVGLEDNTMIVGKTQGDYYDHEVMQYGVIEAIFKNKQL